jgi:hypothetical protein
VTGFILCAVTGFVFVTGIVTNVGTHPYVVLTTNLWLQLKLAFIALAGLNLLTFHLSGMARVVSMLACGRHAHAGPLSRRHLLGLWLGVIYVGRLIPWEL